jgi:hypothetical protein
MVVRLKLLLRVCAVGSSLLLAAAFVAYRAGAMGWLTRAESMAVAASTPPATESAGESPTEKPALLGGSKSMVIVESDGDQAVDAQARPRPRATATKAPEDEVIFGGSKSGIIVSKKSPRPTPARPSAGESSPTRE